MAIGGCDHALGEDFLPGAFLRHPLFQDAGMRIAWQKKNPICPAGGDCFYWIGSVVYSNALVSAVENSLLDPFLWELTELYRDVYGGRPWNEYLICTRKDCSRKFSINEIHGCKRYVSLAVLEANDVLSPNALSCTNCSAPLSFFYPPEDLFSCIKMAFRQQIVATFLFDEAFKLLGFGLGEETTIKEGWHDKLLSGYGDKQQSASLSYADYLEEVHKYIGSEIREEAKAFNVAEYAISVPGRSGGVYIPLLHTFLSTAFRALSVCGEDVPMIGHGLYGSKALDFFCDIGVKYGSKIPGSGMEGCNKVRVYSTLNDVIDGIRGVYRRRRDYSGYRKARV